MNQAENIASNARFITKRDHQVSIYVPNYFQSRFQAINRQAMAMRNATGCKPGDVKTKVRYGNKDFKLFRKVRYGRWSEVQLDLSDLPPLQPPGSVSLSPPKGRTRGNPPAPEVEQNENDPGKRKNASPLSRPSKTHKQSSPKLTSDNPDTLHLQSVPETSEQPNQSPPVSQANKPSLPPSVDLGGFVDNQVFSPGTGKVTFNFSGNNRRQSLNF